MQHPKLMACQRLTVESIVRARLRAKLNLKVMARLTRAKIGSKVVAGTRANVDPQLMVGCRQTVDLEVMAGWIERKGWRSRCGLHIERQDLVHSVTSPSFCSCHCH